MIWVWRLILALLGTLAYYMLNMPEWDNPYFLFYDIPTLPVAFACAGELMFQLSAGEKSYAGIRLAGLLVAAACGAGAQYRSWPLSGHLTVATTVALMQLSAQREPLPWRLISLLPLLLLLGIRTFRPQTTLMGNTFNTISGVLIGALIGGITVWYTTR